MLYTDLHILYDLLELTTFKVAPTNFGPADADQEFSDSRELIYTNWLDEKVTFIKCESRSTKSIANRCIWGINTWRWIHEMRIQFKHIFINENLL